MMISRDVTEGLKQGLLIGAVVLAVAVPMRHHLLPQRSVPTPAIDPAAVATAPPGVAPALPQAVVPAPAVIRRRLDWGGETPSKDVRRLAQWVVDSADNGVQHFVILDKRNARVYVFDPSGKLSGASPVLLGYAAGDDTVPGIGDKAIADVKPQERTTPAGRFVAARGRNASQEDVVWVDYDAAVSMHRVRATNPKERRLERLATPTASDNRISYGCINLPVSFFEQVVWPMFQAHPGVVYVLPEVKPLNQVFPGIETPYHLVSTSSLSHLVSPPGVSAV
ncbi:hypothetical protein [Ideonella sp.]|uniref:hypothetical protein n=1 Tax=Ideonella sp. TaxID=1929293 RepID=UPI0035B0D679